MGNTFFVGMAIVVSVSVPDALHQQWKESNLDLSPSKLFQTALESELNKTNRHLVYWSERALNAEKKLKTISNLINASDKEIKKFLMIDSLD
jgi:post-segregation antitoxin (ccd killing protein)